MARRSSLWIGAAFSAVALLGAEVVHAKLLAFGARATTPARPAAFAQRSPITSPIDPEVERQAKHDLDTARFYFSRRKAYEGAKDRLLEIAAAYPEFTRIDEVYFLLGECFVKTKEPESARKFFEMLLTERPESEFAERAKKRLTELPPAPSGPTAGENP